MIYYGGAPRRRPRASMPEAAARLGSAPATAHLPTNIVDFGGFDSSIILILRGGILMSMGIFPEGSSQGILAGIILVERLGASGEAHVAFRTLRLLSASGRCAQCMSSSISALSADVRLRVCTVAAALRRVGIFMRCWGWQRFNGVWIRSRREPKP